MTTFDAKLAELADKCEATGLSLIRFATIIRDSISEHGISGQLGREAISLMSNLSDLLIDTDFPEAKSLKGNK